MDVSQLLEPDRVIVALRVRDKAELLAELSLRAGAALRLERRPIEVALDARERLGSTGLGRGFGLPHARLPAIKNFFGLFAALARPIEFDAIDEQPVDLVFLLLMPENAVNEHVAALAAISRRMRDHTFAQQLRKAGSASAIYGLLTNANA